MSMSDERFEEAMRFIGGYTTMVADLRARDTAQREALARVEAERQDWTLLTMDTMIQRDTAQAQLAEAVGLIRSSSLSLRDHSHSEGLRLRLDDFLARHAQAEQQEASDAQLDKDARIALLERELDRTRERADMAEVELQHARAALATQPAAGKPIGKVELFGINMTYVEWRDRKMPPLGTELYAAAHGDEAVRKDAERYRWIEPVFAGLLGIDSMDEYIDRAAMRAQAGEGGE